MILKTELSLQKGLKITILFTLLLLFSCTTTPTVQPTVTYEPTWESLKQHDTPQWLKDAKFGIYTHWGIYCYSATHGNATWNSHNAYKPDTRSAKTFAAKYGELTPDFGYKDLIPNFTAENFDADEWADIFARSGARFAGPVAEHHDGFAMWDTRYSEWNAAKMGPRRDVVGELEKAIKARDMKFVTAFHHAASWFFFPVWDETKDCSNPEYSGLYGPIHEPGDVPSKEFMDEWYGKLTEVVDKYDPDFIWFDFALDIIREDYVKNFVAYYYNKAIERGKEVVISYKDHDLPPGVALLDHELGQEPELTHKEWITDTSIDDQGAWGYIDGLQYKSVDRLVDNLVDRVSKNGYLLMNVGPKWDGTIPEGAKNGLLGMGKWLEVNGEAIYGTTSWVKYGEGPTGVKLGGAGNAGFNEADLLYTAKDVRYTVKGDVLYATVLAWPEEDVLIRSLVPTENNENEVNDLIDYPGYYLYPDEIESITMLGDGHALEWELIKGEGLKITPPDAKPCEHAFVFKIVRKHEE